MNRTKALAWFEEVEQKIPGPRSYGPPPRVRGVYDSDFTDPRYQREQHDDLSAAAANEDAQEKAALAFIVAARQAIERVFPPTDPVVRQWREIFNGTNAASMVNDYHVNAGAALFREAHSILRSDRFESLIDGVRAETIGELIDQAEELRSAGWIIPAMVMAGGALESRLAHLCANAIPPIPVEGHGSIEKYNSAIAKRRNEGDEILNANQTKSVTGWGGLRNDAAHTPLKFEKEQTKESVKLAIDGIRQFFAVIG